ncbi:MAG: helix-turn-helix transcriptional regulator [Pseudomonadota bacterium]
MAGLFPYSALQKEVALGVRQRRKDAQLSLRAAADKLGCSETQLNRLEIGMAHVNAGLLVAMAEVYNCSVDDLVDKATRLLRAEKLNCSSRGEEMVEALLS